MRHYLQAVMLSAVASAMGAERVSVNYQVVGDDGMPVTNAEVVTTTQKNAIELSWTAPIKHSRFPVKTDGEGRACCKFSCHHGDFNVYVRAEGYYPEQKLNMSFRTEYDAKRGVVEFLERERSMEIVLNRRIKPIAMYTYAGDRRWRNFGTNKWATCGYDLERNDWLPPVGKGEQADFFVSQQASTEGFVINNCGEMSFSEGCGAYIVGRSKTNAGKLVYSADTNATYLTKFSATRSKIWNGEVLKQSQVLAEGECLVMRTRAKLDEDGNVVSCRYSKIYGPLSIAGAFKYRQSSINPKDDDLNLEFDTGKNLAKKQIGTFKP